MPTAAEGVEKAFRMLDGRWKLVILFHLFGGKLLRFSDLERAIPGISQKMLIQQLRQMENDGIVRRIVHHQVPPKVEYGLTDWGQDGISAVYSFFEPDLARNSLGSFIVIWLIEEAQRRNLSYVYLGYWVAGSQKMDYKRRFRPIEAYGPSGWVRMSQIEEFD